MLRSLVYDPSEFESMLTKDVSTPPTNNDIMPRPFSNYDCVRWLWQCYCCMYYDDRSRLYLNTTGTWMSVQQQLLRCAC